MLKRLVKGFIALVLCTSILGTPVGIFADNTLSGVPSDKTCLDYEAESPEIGVAEANRGTTPRPSPSRPGIKPGEIGTLSQSITPAMKNTAQGIYDDLLLAPVDIFDWTNTGIKESTRMNSISELEYVTRLAREITANCSTTDEIIYTVAAYLAQNLCYDYDYYVHGTHEYPPIDPYTVLQNGYTVCSGYAKTYEAMLQSLGIPCIYVYSPEHEWSAVYNGERWILIDVTWMSNGVYEYGKLRKAKVINEEWFDFSIEEALADYNHIIEETALAVVDGILTVYPVYSELSYIYWPEGIVGIGDHVFRERDHFTGTLSIPDTVKTIGYAAFYECDGFTGDLKLPASLTNVGEVAFYDCDGFSGRLIFGEKLKTVDEWAFASSSFTGDLIIPDGLERIENNTFYYSTFSGKLDLGDGLRYIGEDAFIACAFTGDLIIPDSVTEIGGLAFAYCTFDGKITIGKNVKTIGKFAFYACEFLKGDLIIPDSVTSLGVGSFSFVGITGDIVIGEGITNIPNDCFYAVQYACGDIIVSENVQSIGSRAFLYCSNVRNAYFKGNAPSVYGAGDGSSSFGPYLITLNYKEGTSGWTDSAEYNSQLGTWMDYLLSVWVDTSEETVMLSGFVTTYNPNVSTSVTLCREGEILYTYTIDAVAGKNSITQEFAFDEVASGEYDLVVTKAGHLSYTVKGITVDGDDIVLDFVLVLVAGDVNGDGRVDLKDITALMSENTYGLSYDNAATKSADVNGDKCFDLKDLTVITSETNYGKAPTVVEY